MNPKEQQRVAIATTKAQWMAGLVEGLQVIPLHSYGTEQVALAFEITLIYRFGSFDKKSP